MMSIFVCLSGEARRALPGEGVLNPKPGRRIARFCTGASPSLEESDSFSAFATDAAMIVSRFASRLTPDEQPDRYTRPRSRGMISAASFSYTWAMAGSPSFRCRPERRSRASQLRCLSPVSLHISAHLTCLATACL